VQREVAHDAHVERSQVRVLAASRLSEAETFRAAFRVLLLHVVRSIGAVVALASLHVLLTETSFVFLIANFQSCSAQVAAARLAVREVEESVSALVAGSSDDVRGADARSVVQVALEVSVVDTLRIAVALKWE
jgi:hypothetical protein